MKAKDLEIALRLCVLRDEARRKGEAFVYLHAWLMTRDEIQYLELERMWRMSE